MHVQPDRVVIEVSGDRVVEAEGPRRAAIREIPVVEFVFVRNDTWSLGACGQFAPAAFALGNDWIAVYRVETLRDCIGEIVEVMKPAEFRDRLEHYLLHAGIARRPSPTLIGLQVLDPPSCPRCGWSALEDPESVPLALVQALSCQCRFCVEADRQHEIEAEAGRLSRQAQAREDFDEAAYQDRRRVRALDEAGKALARCERGAQS